MPKAEKLHDISLTALYRPAILVKTKKEFYIEYYVVTPGTNILCRKRIRLNHLRKRYRTIAEFKVMANEMVANINAKLAGGWSPFYQTENTRLYTKLTEVAAIYLAERERELRPATYRTYKSFFSLFLSWCDKNAHNVYASMVNKIIATRYMDYLFMERRLNAVAYNNNLKQARAFFNWAVSKCYVKENPFELVPKKREGKKTRILIPEDYRKRITEYLEKKDPYFLIVCELVYTSLIRPKEVRLIQIKHINLDEMYIQVPCENAKTHNERFPAISESLATKLSYIVGLNRELYLFSPNMRPGIEPCHESYFRKQWDKLRTALNLPIEMQLYSLRDTGINNMLKSGIDPLTVMQHADHHDLSMTTRYANHADPHLIKKIVEQAPDF